MSAKLSRRPFRPYAPPDVGGTKDMSVLEKYAGYKRLVSIDGVVVRAFADVPTELTRSRLSCLALLLWASFPYSEGSSKDDVVQVAARSR